jgi:hypothetical protein
MDDRPAELPPTKASSPDDTFTPAGSAPHSRTGVPWFRAALTVVLVAAALTLLLGREDPALFGAIRERLFPGVSPSPTFTPTPSATPDPLPILQQRSLRISTLAAGEACVTTPGKQVSPDLGDALGEGPVYMVGYGAEGTNTIYRTREDGGWYYLKTLWTAPPRFQDLVLLRGRGVDGPNEVRFSDDTTATPDLQAILSTNNVGSTQSGWLPWINYVRVRAPGCYGIQVDGLTFSEVIHFRIIDTPYVPQA